MSTSDVAGIERIVRDHAEERAARLGVEFGRLVQDLMPRRSGNLANSVVVVDPEETTNGWRVEVTVDEARAPYARYVEEGTGIYGPDGRPIVADDVTHGWTTSRGTQVHRFVFDWPAAGGIVFARRIEGSAGAHMFERAVERWPDVVRHA